MGRALLLTAIATITTGFAAQEKPAQRFSTRTDVVTLDVSVLDRNRQPVKGLRASDFTIREDGKEQAVEYFDAIELPEPSPVTAAWMRDVAPDVVRNTQLAERRLVVILMDDAMTPFDGQMVRSTRDTARRIVDRLGPSDLAAVVFSRDNRRTQNFTADRSRLLAAIEGFESAGYVPPQPGETTSQDFTQFWTDSLQSLYRVVDTLAKLPDRRKTLIHISVGIPIVIDTPDVSKSDHPYLNWLAKQTMTRAQRGNVVIYPVDPGGLDGLRFYMLQRNRRTERWVIEQIEGIPNLYRDFLQSMGEQTGGHAHINTNEFVSRVDQVFRETGSFYLLGYRPHNSRTDGRFRRLHVGVNRPGLMVRTKSGYFEPAPPKPGMALPATDTAIAGLVPKTDLPLELAAAPFAIPGLSDAAVIVTVGGRATEAMSASNVDVLVRAFTPEGDDRGALKIAARVTRQPSEPYELVGRLDLRPGRYELRASVAAGTSGSVYGYVDVPDFSRQTLSLSGIALHVIPAAPSGNADAVSGVLPFAPTTRRTFSPNDRVRAFARVYGAAEADIALVVRVVDARDGVVMEQQRTVAPGAEVTTTLPLDKMSPGRFLLTIDASTGRHIARRALPFDVR